MGLLMSQSHYAIVSKKLMVGRLLPLLLGPGPLSGANWLLVLGRVTSPSTVDG